MCMAKMAFEYSLLAAAKKISEELNKKLSYTTIQSIRDQYREKLKSGECTSEDTVLPTQHRGRPLLISEDLEGHVLKNVVFLI